MRDGGGPEVQPSMSAAAPGPAIEEQLRRVESRLIAEAGGDAVREQDVRRQMTLARARFEAATIRQFLPILIEREVRRRLSAR